MSKGEDKREYFDVVAYVQNKPKKIGYAYKTEKGQIAVRADKMMDNTKLGQLLKKGLYVQKRKYNQNNQNDQNNQDNQIQEQIYRSAAEEYGT